MNKALLDKLFEGFSILRWNDMPRSMPLVELDKHAHKMMYAWLVGALLEARGARIAWPRVIEGGVFELFKRLVCSDIQAPIFRAIERRLGPELRAFHAWIHEQLRALLPEDLEPAMRTYLLDEDAFFEGCARERLVLEAAHRWSSLWELENLIAPVHPRPAEVHRIRENLRAHIRARLVELGLPAEELLDAAGVHAGLAPVMDRLGFLRTQIRWAHTPRLPATSVLGHSMFVATTLFFLVRASNRHLELADETAAARLANTFFRGLFHDIGESLTRDIIRPVKRAIERRIPVIAELEAELLRDLVLEPLKRVHPHPEARLRLWITDEFTDRIGGEAASPEAFVEGLRAGAPEPVDGWLVKAADDLAAFLEARKAILYGMQAPVLVEAAVLTRARYGDEEARAQARRLGVPLARIYADLA